MDYFAAWQSERMNVAEVTKYTAIIAVIIRSYASALFPLILYYIEYERNAICPMALSQILPNGILRSHII
jgi:hypothetical protein